MSDLQCPATIYVLGPVENGPAASSESGRPAEPVSPPVGRDDARIALVRCAPQRETLGRRLADDLDCALLVEESLAGELRSALSVLADLHRGESIIALPATGYPGRPAGRWLRVLIDADGTTVTEVG